jgi:hypothetical protein
LAVNGGGEGPRAIRPVNYVFDERSQSVVFRTALGSKFYALLSAAHAAFEVDGIDEGSSVNSELKPRPPVRCAWRYLGIRWIRGSNGWGSMGAPDSAAIVCAADSLSPTADQSKSPLPPPATVEWRQKGVCR